MEKTKNLCALLVEENDGVVLWKTVVALKNTKNRTTL